MAWNGVLCPQGIRLLGVSRGYCYISYVWKKCSSVFPMQRAIIFAISRVL